MDKVDPVIRRSRQETDQTGEEHANEIGRRAAAAEQVVEGIVEEPEPYANPPVRPPV